MAIDPYYAPITKLSPEALCIWLRLKGVSFFPEELVAAERMVDSERKAAIARDIEKLLAERKSRPKAESMPAARAIAEHVEA